MGPHWGRLVFSVIYTAYYIALVPLFLKLVTRSLPSAEPVRG